MDALLLCLPEKTKKGLEYIVRVQSWFQLDLFCDKKL